MVDNIVLSIIVTTYNHENYIEKAIDSILMQKVNFNYEVLIGEDCSTDNTRSILKHIEKRTGDNFHYFYREINCRADKIGFPYGNGGDLKLRSKGKYIITLEGDDYWTDPNKLQSQVDFLESHDDYYACSHKCIVVDENNKKRNETYNDCNESVYNLRYMVSDILPGQTATFMYRNPYVVYQESELDFLLNEKYYIGDRRNVFFAATHGKIACMNKYMSAYRHVTNHGSSFSANNSHAFDREYPHYKSFLDYCILNCITGDEYLIAEMMIYLFLFKSLIRRKIRVKDFFDRTSTIIHKKYCFVHSILYLLRKAMGMRIAY